MNKPLPPIVFELTYEQQFEMRKLENNIKEADRDTILECVSALIRHNFVLKNTISNLIHHWNEDEFESDSTGADVHP